jgi:alpha-tubulin suppressor-like RCC1 family protein
MQRLLVLFILIVLQSCLGTADQNENSFGVNDMPKLNINLFAVNPNQKNLLINESFQFVAAGGTPPYKFYHEAGVGSISENGFFLAGAVAGVASVRCMDAKQNSAYAVINVNTPLQISPTSATIGTNGSQLFVGLGGNPPYQYSIEVGNGTVNSTSGLFSATSVSGASVIKVVDSTGASAYAGVTVTTSLSVMPNSLILGFSEQYQLSLSGGQSPYNWQIISGQGAITSTGLFSAGNSVSNTLVRVTDGLGNKADAIISVVDKPKLGPRPAKVAIIDQKQLVVTGGTAPFAYSKIAGEGSVSITGLYTPPTSISQTIIRVTDAYGFYDDLVIENFKPRKIAMNGHSLCVASFYSQENTEVKCTGVAGTGAGTAGFLAGTFDVYSGDEPGEMGDNLPHVDLGTSVEARAVITGYYRSCVITHDYRLKCWGLGSNHGLGRGNTTNYGALSDEMGDNLPFFPLGTNRTIDSTLPIEDTLTLGNSMGCVILDGGELKCWGFNANGQLASSITTHIGDTANELGDGWIPVNFGAGVTVKKVENKNYITCALTNLNQLKCWGLNVYGQLGQGNVLLSSTGNAATEPVSIPAINVGTGRHVIDFGVGVFHVCALLDNNRVKCWGRNDQGQLGLELPAATNIGTAPGEMGDNLAYVDLGEDAFVQNIEVGSNHNCAHLTDGRVKCWGYNLNGQLGQGTSTNVGNFALQMGDNLPAVNFGVGRTAVKLKTGFNNNCAILDNGEMKCWGLNTYGQLGLEHNFEIGKSPFSLGANLPATIVSSNYDVDNVSLDIDHSCVKLSNNKVKCWGAPFRGEAGRNILVGDEPGENHKSRPSVNLGTGLVLSDITMGLNSACATFTNGQAKCWGFASNGALANGSAIHRGVYASEMGDNLPWANLGNNRTITSLSAGSDNACASFTDGKVKCWGNDLYGLDGIAGTQYRGDALNEIGENLPEVPLFTADMVTKVVVGEGSACSLFNSGKIKCWGQSFNGNLGINRALNDHVGDNAGEMDTLPFIDLGVGNTAMDICGGSYVVCALLQNNQLKCWGHKDYIGQESSVNHVGDALGEVASQPLINFGLGRTVKKFSCKHAHVCAILDNNQLKCFGWNQHGQLGRGHVAIVGNASYQMGDFLPSVELGTDRYAIDIFASYHNTCAVLDNNDVKCWGLNNNGQLGLGHRFNPGASPLTMGDYNLPLRID